MNISFNKLLNYFFLLFFLFFINFVQAVDLSECTTITSSGSYYLINDVINPDDSSSCFNIQASSVTLDCRGYRIANSDSLDATGVVVNGEAVNVLNCIIDGFPYGIDVKRGSGKISGNSIKGSSFYGIWLNGNGDPVIEKNSVVRSSGNGIFVENGSPIVRENTLENIRSYVIWLSSPGSPLVENNFIKTFGYVDLPVSSGIYVGEGSPVIRGNTIENTNEVGNYGIVLDYYSDIERAVVENNVIKNVAAIGIWVKLKRAVLTGNIVDSAKKRGIRLSQTAEYVVLTSNIIKGDTICPIIIESPVNPLNSSIILTTNDVCGAVDYNCNDEGLSSYCNDPVKDGGGNKFVGETNCGIKNNFCGIRPTSAPNTARAPSNEQGDVSVVFIALAGVLLFGGFLWWHSKKAIK